MSQGCSANSMLCLNNLSGQCLCTGCICGILPFSDVSLTVQKVAERYKDVERLFDKLILSNTTILDDRNF